MAKIAVLSDQLINKIAAGEVVERPASVVKELAENSIDAGARTVRVAIDGGGLGRIRVVDDGEGMSREDAVLSLTRHATSKLSSLASLFSIETLGFRGEALPSIAAVSRFQLTTSERGASVGTTLVVEGGAHFRVEQAAPAGGTAIEVADLFFNTPARRKFLRRQETELKHCEEAVWRLALAHPEIGFFLEHEGKSVIASPATPADPRERIAAALGGAAHPHLLPIEERRLGIAVQGFVASPAYSLPNARGIYVFVNGRYIRDRGMTFAIQRAFQEALAPRRQPVAIVHLGIDPHEVDVNVHPQKLEVRFSDGRGIADAVLAAVSRALRASAAPGSGVDDAPQTSQYAMAVEHFLTRAQVAGWGAPLPFPSAQEPQEGFGRPDAPAFGEARPGINEAPPAGFFSALKPLGPIGVRFWACEGAGGSLIVIDAHAARERRHFTALRKRFVDGRAAPPQQSLFTGTVELSASMREEVLDRRRPLAELGIEVESFGGSTLAFRALPPELTGANLTELLNELTGVLSATEAPLDVTRAHDALQLMACRSAAGPAAVVSLKELTVLLSMLDDCEFHTPCLHSKIVVLNVPVLELERRAE